MLFRYRAIKNDKITTGKVEAQTEAEAVAFLRKNGLLTIDIAFADMASVTALTGMFSRPSFNDIVHLTRQISIMMNAGLTVIDSFDILKRQITKASLLKVIDSIDKDIRSGESLSAALKKYPYLFSNLYVALVEAGEASGKVNDVLSRLAENLEKQREFQGKLKSALIYPTIIMIGMVVVMFVMVTFVLPQLLTLYKDLDIDLPLMTRILIAVSNFSSNFWPFIIAAAVGVTVAVRKYLKSKTGKNMADRLSLKLPVLSGVIRMASLVDATRTLAILIGSGVSILDGLRIIIDTADNVVFKEAFKNIYVQVEKGVSLGQAMQKEKVFPPILVQMTSVGEQTGHLDTTLHKISAYFEFESEFAIKALTSLIEPAIIVVLGLGVGLLVISVITPIYNLTNKF